MNKKLVLSVLSTAVVASMASAAMAKPGAGFYVGGDVDKYYSINAFFDNFDEALDNILDNMEATVFVDGNANAAPFLVALEAEDINTVLKPAQQSDFEDNVYENVEDPTKPYNPAEDDFEPVPVGDLVVESVSAINNLQIQVSFNKAVDKDTATSLSNYTLTSDGGNAVLTGGSAELLDDNKTVVLTLSAAAANQDTEELTVKNVKDLEGNKVAEFKKDIHFLDLTLPVAERVQVVGTKTLKVVFSEPVDVTSGTPKFTLDNGKYSAPAAQPGDNKNEVLLTLSTVLPAGEHTLTVEGVEDYASFKNAKTELKFDYAADTTAPTLSIKEVKDADTVVFKFSKEVDNLVNNANVLITHTYNNATNQVTGAAVTKLSNTEFEVDFTNPLPPGTATIYVKYAANTKDTQKVKDGFGNVLELPVTFQVQVDADTVAPTVTGVEVTEANQIEVQFSEDVTKASAELRTNYKLTDKDSKAVQISKVEYDASEKTATITTTANLKAGTYQLEVKNVVDTAVVANKMEPFTTTLTVADKVAPKVSSVVLDATGNGKLVVKFDKAMSEAGLSDLANYSLVVNGKVTAFPAGTKASIKDSKTVEITLGKAVTGLDAASDVLQVSGNLTDENGNKIGGMAVSVDIDAAASVKPALVADSAKFVGVDTITFEVDRELKAIDPAKIKFGTDGSEAAVDGVSYVNQGNKALVTVVLSSPITNTSSTGWTGEQVLVEAGALTPVLGAANDEIEITAIADKVAPVISAAETADKDGNGQIDQLTVTFSEDVLASSIQTSDFELSDGYSVQSIVSIKGDEVVLKLVESGNEDTGATPTITIAGAIEDLKGNEASALDAFEGVVDKVAPVLLSAEAKDANTIVLTFSEAVEVNETDDILDNIAAVLDPTGAGTALTVSSVAVDPSDSTKVEVVVDENLANGNEVKVTYSQDSSNEDTIADTTGNEVADGVNKTFTVSGL